MNNGKLRTGRVEGKIDCNDFRESLQINAIKNEPREIEIFSECDSYQYQNEGKLDAKNPNLEELGHSECLENSLTSKCNTLQIKKEEDVDIFYEDFKSVVDEKSSKSFRFCEVCHQSFGMEADIFKSTSYRFECSCQKPNESLSYNSCGEMMTHFGLSTGSFFKGFNSETYLVDHDHNYAFHRCHAPVEEKLHEKNLNPKDSGQYKSSENTVRVKNEDDIDIFYEDIKSETGEKKSDLQIKPLSVRDETSGDEAAEKQDSSTIPRRLSVPHKETEKEMENKLCPESLNNNPSVAVKKIHCKICSKYFSRMSNFKKHEKRHTGDKPFHCKLCSKSFIRKDNLKTHEWCHTGSKPFYCKICSKSFTTSSYLRVHVRDHTGERPFHCGICSKSFSHIGAFKIHERSHTGEKPFHCQICSKSFSQMGTMKRHERGHTGE